MKTIMIVEDEKSIRDELKTLLETSGYKVILLERFDNTLEDILKSKFDLLLLDINLPKMNGETLLKEFRKQSNIPVIMVTSRVGETDEVLSMSYGADDYITKPFSMDELLARISAHLRREERSHHKTRGKFSEELVIDYGKRSVYIKGKLVELSNKEFEIIRLLSRNAGQVFDREKIYEIIWGIDGSGDSTVIKEHIRKIRIKFAEYTEKTYISTVWGVGYKWIN